VNQEANEPAQVVERRPPKQRDVCFSRVQLDKVVQDSADGGAPSGHLSDEGFQPRASLRYALGFVKVAALRLGFGLAGLVRASEAQRAGDNRVQGKFAVTGGEAALGLKPQ
jgi:hypothetical protein